MKRYLKGWTTLLVGSLAPRDSVYSRRACPGTGKSVDPADAAILRRQKMVLFPAHNTHYCQLRTYGSGVTLTTFEDGQTK